MRETGKKIFLILFSILFTLLLGEGLLQITYRIQKGQWVWQGNAFKYEYLMQTDDRRGYSLRPSFYDKVQNIPVNERGERDTGQDAKIAGNPNIVVCLGDSVPFGAGIGNDVTYPVFLAKDLHEADYPHYVINAGVPSYNFRQSFDRLHLDIFTRVAPHRVNLITLQAANDISLLTYYRENWTPDVTWGNTRFNISPIPGSNYLAISYYLSQLLSQPKGAEKELDIPEKMNSVEEILIEELANVIELNPDVKIILLPVNPFYYQTMNTENNSSLGQWEPNKNTVANWDNLVKSINQTLAEVSDDFGNVYFFDIVSAMDMMERDGLYIDYIHLSGDGSEIQADLVFEYIQQHHLLPISE